MTINVELHFSQLHSRTIAAILLCTDRAGFMHCGALGLQVCGAF